MENRLKEDRGMFTHLTALDKWLQHFQGYGAYISTDRTRHVLRTKVFRM